MSSSNSRPRTPPISSYSNTRSTKSPPPARPGAGLSSPPQRRPYNDFISHTHDDWNADDDEDDGEGEAIYDDNHDDDEDDFGLPSITSVRRKAKPSLAQASKDPGASSGAHFNGVPSLNAGIKPGRGRANSTDIAEERGPPSYPTAKNAEGKILRPQYKDILKGKASISTLRRYPLTVKTQTQQTHCT